ncbi:MAG: YqgE/AlgH family protein [Thermoguttaceae bacterium]
MANLAGNLLAASPHLLDPNFVRSVVLLMEHNDQGAFGLVINRPINKSVQDLWREVGGGPCTNTQAAYLGGPVPGPLLAVHGEESLSEMKIAPGVYFSASKQNLDALVILQDPTIKIFIGHSGWGPGQLDQELAQGAWFTTPGTADFVFLDNTVLWTTISRHIGHEMLRSMLKIKNVPDDPRLN